MKCTMTPRWIQGRVTVGNSISPESTGPSVSSMSTTRLIPAEVLGTKAISSASAPTKRATLARTASRRAIHSSQGPSPSCSIWR